MTPAALLTEGFGRIVEGGTAVVEGLTEDQLTQRVGPDANTIAWLVWHLARVQDSHIAELLDQEQIYLTGDWAPRFGLKPNPSETGYGHSSAQVAQVAPESWEALTGYYEAVHERTVGYLGRLTGADLDRVVDESWDPPVTLGVRLVSVLSDDLQHAGQAAFVRGILQRR
jgi:uncharacterized damage-inducible protein DinB